MTTSAEKYVLGLDVGTTTIRAFVYRQSNGNVVGEASESVVLLYPKPGWSEIEPMQLWEAIIKVLKGAIKDSGVDVKSIVCMGISTQRATFTTWNKYTNEEFHNFITWKDVRADSLVREWNSSLSMRSIRVGSGLLYFLTRQKRFRVASLLHIQNKMVVMRLAWVLQNVISLRNAVSKQSALFGTLETWLLYKFSMGKRHISDIGNASATGLYDPFTLDYGDWAFKLFNIPKHIMPLVVDSAGDHFGSIDKSILGHEIPIRAVMADQSAAVFGSGCFKKGDTKMTLGTGSFLDVNTGEQPHASINGLVPVVGWRYKKWLAFMAEGSIHDTSSMIEWARQLNLFDDPNETSDIAKSVSDDNFALYFVPGFFGLQAPINDITASAGMIGLTPTTSSKEILRSVLEAVAFTMKQLQETMQSESDYKLHNIQIDGGVSRNDFVVQMISNLTGKRISRSTSTEMSAFGAAFLAGLDAGVWQSVDDLSQLRQIERIFEPNEEEAKLQNLKAHYQKWIEACYRFTDWNVPNAGN